MASGKARVSGAQLAKTHKRLTGISSQIKKMFEAPGGINDDNFKRKGNPTLISPSRGERRALSGKWKHRKKAKI